MAARGIALGRIIDWARNGDPEEVKYALHRMGNILQERMARVEKADAAGKVKRTRRARTDAAAQAQRPAENHPGALAASEY